jgi:hypothetical protein
MTGHVDSARARSAGAGRHRAEVRPRYGRIATLGSSVAVMLIAVLGGTGALPSSADDPPARDSGAAAVDPGSVNAASDTDADERRAPESEAPADPAGSADPDAGGAAEESPAADPFARADAPDRPEDDGLVPIDPSDAGLIDTALPGDSGSGKRVVFSESRQRVWLVTEEGTVRRTYLVSGSVYDNLDPGTFEVYSRDKDAVGIDDSGTMRFFVRFTQGDSGAAIGFHDIPVDAGMPVQTLEQLGTPLSHGCIRQRRADAVALWKFAPIGTTVVVTA